MKKLILTFAILLGMGTCASAQSITVYDRTNPVSFRASNVDKITFSSADSPVGEYSPSDKVAVDGHWCSLGTSITWYNNHVSSAFTKGYQSRVLEQIQFSQFTNKGVNASLLSSAPDQVVNADYYTIEHGINDWGHSTAVGTIEDYVNDTRNGTFAASYRILIDKIYATNPKAMIILCTPRKAYGFGDFLPSHWYDALNGIYLEDYVKLIREIADYESLPVADFFRYAANQHNLASLSIDQALHPNDTGYQIMANILVEAFRKVLIPKP